VNRVAEMAVSHPRRCWSLIFACALGAAATAAWFSYALDVRASQRQLEIASRRTALETMSLTLDGKLMGAISLLGLIDPEIKREALGKASPNNEPFLDRLHSLALAYGAQGVFVVGADGKVKSSWDDSGRSATGLDVAFRPYTKMAMRGRENVYAAISLTRDERALYFAAPIHASMERGGNINGLVAARTDMSKLDNLLINSGKLAMLLSPQGVVFASTRPEWQGWLSGKVSAQRLGDIRQLRQFATLFDGQSVNTLPFDIGKGSAWLGGRRYAMTTQPIYWNDPAGDWQLLMMDDLTPTLQPANWLPAALSAAFATLLFGILIVRLLRSRHAQQQSVMQLESLARAQEARAERKMQLAQVALHMQQASSSAAAVQAFLADCHLLFGAMQAVVYATAQGGTGSRLLLAGQFASHAPPASIAFGEGLLGQCALERLPRLVDSGEAAAPWAIRSALGGMPAAALVLAPVLLQQRLLGAIELALAERPDDERYAQLLAAIELLAINLEIDQRKLDPALGAMVATPA
jgi:two-component system C4-dicarboxylate transport sensor histidine kinase DctB